MSSQTELNNMSWVTVTPVVQAAAYAAGDVVAVPIVITGLFGGFNPNVLLQSLHILDKGDQAAALDIIFFKSPVTLGTINAAVSISDVNALEIIGVVEVVADDYVDLIGSQYAIPQFNPMVLSSGDHSVQNGYVAVVARGTPTYASTSDLVLQLGIIR